MEYVSLLEVLEKRGYCDYQLDNIIMDIKNSIDRVINDSIKLEIVTCEIMRKYNVCESAVIDFYFQN